MFLLQIKIQMMVRCDNYDDGGDNYNVDDYNNQDDDAGLAPDGAAV